MVAGIQSTLIKTQFHIRLTRRDQLSLISCTQLFYVLHLVAIAGLSAAPQPIPLDRGSMWPVDDFLKAS
jgi:hypothetical protein